ncbi:MAG TPA: trypsin-like serine protease [Polyangiaceae bacterium]|jgi:hypothetical protein|nr:trypsin-like serine protease [Polyangiaceae bacterium]
MTFVRATVTFVAGVLLFMGCSGEASTPSSLAGAPHASIVDPIAGIPDPGADPAVVLLASDDGTICAGTLIAQDAVLTARHCVSASHGPPSCSSPDASLVDPASVAVVVGENDAAAQTAAHGRAILVASDAECDADIAVLLLDALIDGIEPMVVRSTGAAEGDLVRTVGFATLAGSRPTKVVRDRVAVVQTDDTELRLYETPCEDGCGGPIIDESSAQIVGVLSGPSAASGTIAVSGTSSDGAVVPWDVGVRADAFSALIKQGLAEAAPPPSSTGRAKTKKGSVDAGANCDAATDCAAGVCVTDGARQYCSMTCSSRDRCPALFRCEKAGGPAGLQSVCVES